MKYILPVILFLAIIFGGMLINHATPLKQNTGSTSTSSLFSSMWGWFGCFWGTCGQRITIHPTFIPTPTPISTNNSLGYGFFEEMHYPELTSIPSANIQNPYLSGPSFNFHWAQLEPVKGQLDTSAIDNVLKLWSAQKKKIILLIKTAPGGAEHNPWADSATPKWVYAEGAKSVTVIEQSITQQIPLYWDPIFQQEYQSFINLLAQRYDGNANIEFIIVGPGVFGTTRAIYPKDLAIFQKAGYTDQKWYGALDTIQQFYQQAFHRTALALEMGPFIDDTTAENSQYNHWSIAQLAAQRGFILSYHNLRGTSDWYDHIPALPVPPGASWTNYPEFFASFGTKAIIALGRDNPSSGSAQALQKYGDPVTAVQYAFGGVAGIPVINTHYITFYEKDVAAGTTGDPNFQQRYQDAMKLAVQTWQTKFTPTPTPTPKPTPTPTFTHTPTPTISGTPVSLKIPHGIFSLGPDGAPVNSSVLSNPLVTGISLRDRWPNIELSQGTYNWSYLDGEIARAAQAGKQVILRGVSGGVNTPAWVFNKGIQTFTFIDTNPYHSTYNTAVTIPVYWDPVFLAAKESFIKAMGQHFANNPNVFVVGSSCANAHTDDWSVPNSPTDIANWKKIGYTSDKLITACEQIIDTTMAAFPNKPVLMAFNNVKLGLDPSPDYVPKQIIAYANATYPGRFVAQENSLAANTPDPALTTSLGKWQIVFDDRPTVAAQMLWFVTNDKTCRMNGQVTPCDPATMLKQAITIGAHYGTLYQEIYQNDLVNPALASVVQYAAGLLSSP